MFYFENMWLFFFKVSLLQSNTFTYTYTNTFKSYTYTFKYWVILVNYMHLLYG